MKPSLADALRGLPGTVWKSEMLFIRPIENEDDLWFATVECTLRPGQEEFVNPAGFSIGRAYLSPQDNLPCVICKADGERIGYIVFRMWLEKAAEPIGAITSIAAFKAWAMERPPRSWRFAF